MINRIGVIARIMVLLGGLAALAVTPVPAQATTFDDCSQWLPSDPEAACLDDGGYHQGCSLEDSYAYCTEGSLGGTTFTSVNLVCKWRCGAAM